VSRLPHRRQAPTFHERRIDERPRSHLAGGDEEEASVRHRTPLERLASELTVALENAQGLTAIAEVIGRDLGCAGLEDLRRKTEHEQRDESHASKEAHRARPDNAFAASPRPSTASWLFERLNNRALEIPRLGNREYFGVIDGLTQ
jgi:hypothetical protein